MNFKAFLNTISTKVYSLPIVVLYVTEGCNLQCVMCSYRDPLPNELTLQDIESLASRLQDFGLRHIVFSGGEPLMRRDFPSICNVFIQKKIKHSLLTNGLLLEKRFKELPPSFSEIIVSIDGCDETIHNSIRGINSFGQIIKGIEHVRANTPNQQISIRTVLQKKNFRHLKAMIDFAKSIKVNRISFLAADILSDSFGRANAQIVQNQSDLTLSEPEIDDLKEIIKGLERDRKADFETKFISESPQKLYHIAQYYEALLGKAPFPQNICNAPMASTVIRANGELLPCFFLPSIGKISSEPIEMTLNNHNAVTTRKQVKQYELSRCQTCVCTLRISPFQALQDSF